jgi:hypothetical protein
MLVEISDLRGRGVLSDIVGLVYSPTSHMHRRQYRMPEAPGREQNAHLRGTTYPPRLSHAVKHVTIYSDTPFLLRVAPLWLLEAQRFPAWPVKEAQVRASILLQCTAGAETALESDRDRFSALRRLDDAHRDRLTFGQT